MPAGDNKTLNGRENVMNVMKLAVDVDMLKWLCCGPLAF